MENFFEITDVVKRNSGHTALDGVTLDVPRGCIYGLLGPNGAGKTSLIRIINRITRQDSGDVLLDQRPITDDDVTRIGYMPEERGLYKKMKVRDQIVYLARLKGMPASLARSEANQWLRRFELEEWADKKLEALSKGMAQKVQFIATVIHRPQLLIFDEPFSGFDPVNAEMLKREIIALRDGGATILFSTHNMASVEDLCEQITLINQSRVVLQGNVDEIRHNHKKNIFAVTLEGKGELPSRPELYTVMERQGDDTIVKLVQGADMRAAIAWLNDNCHLTGFHEILPGMNEVFIDTVNHSNAQYSHEQA